jgi:exosortase B
MMLPPESPHFDRERARRLMPAVLLAAGLLVMLAPVFVKLAHTVWNTDEQGHGPIILAVVLWLLWLRRERFKCELSCATPAGIGGWLLLLFGLAVFVVGRVQSLVMFEMGAAIPVLAGAMAVTFSWRAVKIAAFPIFFLVFAVPLPGAVVDMLTHPLKQAVSYVAEVVLYKMGYPISRTGVILIVGQYQLLVADACAGLNSIFTLEALGLLYMNLAGRTSHLRNIVLAMLIVPMSFTANVVRVMVLVLVTYRFGDEVGQGFIHGAAGMLLFLLGIALMFLIDRVLNLVTWKEAVR